jgi:hypothetical protein
VTGSIQRIIDWALAHPGFVGCENEVLKRFCDKENCFYHKLISERITTTNMKVT